VGANRASLALSRTWARACVFAGNRWASQRRFLSRGLWQKDGECAEAGAENLMAHSPASSLEVMYSVLLPLTPNTNSLSGGYRTSPSLGGTLTTVGGQNVRTRPMPRSLHFCSPSSSVGIFARSPSINLLGPGPQVARRGSRNATSWKNGKGEKLSVRPCVTSLIPRQTKTSTKNASHFHFQESSFERFSAFTNSCAWTMDASCRSDACENEEEEEDDELRHLSCDERIVAIKRRARPEISRDGWARRRAHALDLDDRLGPPLNNCARVHAAQILKKSLIHK
jgi:hypothetical protein